MTNKEQIKRDITIAMDFAEQILENPGMLDNIPNGASIAFLNDDNSKPEKLSEKDKLKKYVKVKRSFEVL